MYANELPRLKVIKNSFILLLCYNEIRKANYYHTHKIIY